MMFVLSVLALVVTPYVMAFFWYRREKKGRAHRIYALDYEPGQLKRELKNSIWMPIHATIAATFYLSGAFRNDSVLSYFGTVLLTYVWAEVFHYYSHLSFHHKSLLWIHEEHHKSKINSPFTALSFSFVEKLIFSVCIFALPALVDRFITPVNYYGIVTWYLGYLIINSFAHANFEPKSDKYLDRVGRWITSTTYHSLHHSRYVKNYGLGTRFLDRLHDTEWADYERVFVAAKSNQPLSKLREKK